MSYNLSTKPQKIVLEVSNPTMSLGVTSQQHSISLSRTGGQGSQGVSVVDAEVVGTDLVLTLSDGNTVNAGNIAVGVTGNAPTDLDTLEKIAQAINNDPNFFQTLRPMAYSGSLSDVETGTLTTGSVTGGSY